MICLIFDDNWVLYLGLGISSASEELGVCLGIRYKICLVWIRYGNKLLCRNLSAVSLYPRSLVSSLNPRFHHYTYSHSLSDKRASVTLRMVPASGSRHGFSSESRDAITRSENVSHL
jgi:hypothetical protein